MTYYYYLSFFLLLSAAAAGSSSTHTHNITRILAKHPEFSTFNHYLSATHLADEINRRRTITVCVVNNAAMSDLLSRHFSIPTIKNILSLHVFADYFSAKKLHRIAKGSATTSSLFQATGQASGTSGYISITAAKGGKVAFSLAKPDDEDDGDDDDDDDDDEDNNRPMASFVKSVADSPYEISVIHISHILTSPEAEAPTASPTDLNITALMAKQGCKSFADMISAADGGVGETLALTLAAGLTVFCPSDEALKTFAPKFKNLTAEGKTSLLLYHALPEYNSLGTLRSSNGLINTMATEGGKKKYDFSVQNDGNDVKIETKVVTATVKGTLIDNDPLAVYKVDKVLLPRELFKAPPPAPSPRSKSVDSDDDTGDEDDGKSRNGGERIVMVGLNSIFGVLAFGLLT